MKLLDQKYTQRPYYGSRRYTNWLKTKGYEINRKRVQRLMKVVGIEAIYPKPSISIANKEHRKFPYLLKDIKIERVNQVWSTDITYIPMHNGFMYLTAVMDWISRYVLSWRISENLESEFCVEALKEALTYGKPEIFNTDQGRQFTSKNFTERLLAKEIAISMDGKGRAFDNIFVERLWRTVKYEEVYLKDYENPKKAKNELKAYFNFYNEERQHQALGYRTPKTVYYA